MHFDLPTIITWLIHYKYLLLFPIVVVEGPIVTIIGGFLVSLGYLNFFLAYLVLLFGDLVGDSLYYSIGRWGRNRFIERWGRYVGITAERLALMEAYFEKHGGKSLFFGKLTHAVGGVILVAAGMAKVPFWKFIWYNFLATLPKALILMLIGFYFGQAYAQLNRYLDYTALVTVAVVVLLIILYLVVRKIGKKYEDGELG
jgi:membrane protein DedA with SNARE-associated domain